MWTWLRTLLPEPEPVAPFAGDADGINWYNVAQNQRFAVLRKGGLINLASTWRFALFGGRGAFCWQSRWGGNGCCCLHWRVCGLRWACIGAIA
ncbi:hypothetical protein [Thiothrix subterranea]|uniref:hypothetical protein n=1 Tax=Thiothrix subterranea TaxID=2735563 RepID=UPI00280BBF8C|nr:hypothetical protein [Thiothrix subterranea]